MHEKGHVPKDQALWNAVATLAFVTLAILGFGLLTHGGRFVDVLYYLDFFDVLIMGLATFRLIRLVTYDKIFSFVREFFLHEVEGVYVKCDSGFKRLMSELIECMWCTGLWAGLFVFVAYLAHPIGTFVVYVLAVAALGSFFQNVSKAVASTFEK
ncbi:MAG: DUF1360 domain-containing protein [Candidatus Pacebacteria bacterium]|nr:DUF1360 domain-containing protein [Candidatus Paceibacterota bacterium]